MLSSLLKILHYCPISPCIQQPCSAALHGRLARQPCPAALPGSLARQSCPAALHGSLARQPSRQPCPAALPSSLARQSCPAGWPGSLARQFDQFRPDLMRSLRSNRTVLQWQVTKLLARAAVLTGLNLFLVQFHHAFIICMRALLSSRQEQTCSVVQCSYVDLSAVYCKFFTQTRVRTEVIFSLVNRKTYFESCDHKIV
jgi:hypothetical protein